MDFGTLLFFAGISAAAFFSMALRVGRRIQIGLQAQVGCNA